jgi:pimeloyl-ACP methyl ester carboxylesterase
VVGLNWDIIGFDPRGMSFSKPLAKCSANASSNQNLALASRSVPRVTDEFYNSFIQLGKALGEECEKAIGGETGIGRHMSTATNARDMLSIVDAFADTEDGKRTAKPSNLLNYYGVSYGTFLGETFASMFPNRVGNVVLDGMVSSEGYLTNFTSHSVDHTDGIIAAFFIYCHQAGLPACPYYTGSTPKDVYDRFNRSFSQLDPRYATVNNWSNATDLDDALLVLKIGLLSAAAQPLTNFALLAQSLLDLEGSISAQDIRPWVEKAKAVFLDPTTAGYNNAEWTLGVLCSDQDNRWYNKTLEDLRPQLAELESQSIIGEIWSKSMLGCTGWSIKAAEIFTGPFGGDTATPILFVSNTYDSATPIEKCAIPFF